MKIKPFAMLAMTGLVAASLAYVAPAIADENDFNDQSFQALADNGQNQSNEMNNNPILQSDNTSSSTPTPSSDAASPDTATGDDDY